MPPLAEIQALTRDGNSAADGALAQFESRDGLSLHTNEAPLWQHPGRRNRTVFTEARKSQAVLLAMAFLMSPTIVIRMPPPTTDPPMSPIRLVG